MWLNIFRKQGVNLYIDQEKSSQLDHNKEKLDQPDKRKKKNQPDLQANNIQHNYYNKNQWEVYPCLEIQVNCFCVGIFHESEGRMKYPFTKNNEPDLQTRIHHELVLVFMPSYFCFDDINV